MSCNAACFIDTTPGYSGRGLPVYGTRSGPSYAGPSYFSDPTAITALEFEKGRKAYSRDPLVSAIYMDGKDRRYDMKDEYLKKPQLAYGPPQPMLIGKRTEISPLDQTVEYFNSLMAGTVNGQVLDYSLMANARNAMQQLRAIMGNSAQVIPAQAIQDPGAIRMYTLINEMNEDRPLIYRPKQRENPGIAEESQAEGKASMVNAKRALLEDLIRKDLELLVN